MNVKVIVGSLIVVVFLVFGAMSFMDSNVEYTDIAGAKAKGKKVQLKGTWNRDRESAFDASTGRFTAARSPAGTDSWRNSGRSA